MNNTTMAILLIASAAMLIGGLVIPLTTTTAMAAKPDFQYCAHGGGVFPGAGTCGSTLEECEFSRDLLGIQGRCHPEPITEEEE